MSERSYVHGYSESEAKRLSVQAETLNELLYGDTVYPPGSLVLEAGCGVGAQTSIIATNSPGARIISIDISGESLAAARKKAIAGKNTGAEHLKCDIFSIPFAECSFDHIFVCFVLEHLHDPKEALVCLLRLLKPGGTMTVIEGDHGSYVFYPDSPEAKRSIQCLIDLQAVGAVTVFDEDTPEELIGVLLPDILVKGADWPVEKIAGAKAVLEHGGSVLNVPLLEGRSTSSIIEKVIEAYGGGPRCGTP